MLSPKIVRHRKVFKGRIKGLARSGTGLDFGAYGLRSLDAERVTARQIEAARRAISRAMRRQGKLWIRIFPDLPVSKKPAEVRMGKGKGSTEYWVARVRPGRMIFEMDGVDEVVARRALQLAASKLPVRCRFVQRHVED